MRVLVSLYFHLLSFYPYMSACCYRQRFFTVEFYPLSVIYLYVVQRLLYPSACVYARLTTPSRVITPLFTDALSGTYFMHTKQFTAPSPFTKFHCNYFIMFTKKKQGCRISVAGVYRGFENHR
jgi:hypothetical protein